MRHNFERETVDRHRRGLDARGKAQRVEINSALFIDTHRIAAICTAARRDRDVDRHGIFDRLKAIGEALEKAHDLEVNGGGFRRREGRDGANPNNNEGTERP
jgi:hypothetical protein